MAVKVLIKRTLKGDDLKAASRLLINARRGAMSEKGYISSENLLSVDNPKMFVVASNWQKLEDWENWKKSEARKENEKEFSELLAKPTEYEIYEMGFTME
ncbi:MAG: antibiotic biosynthesis monooxygenase [Desulfobacterales bacterium]